MNMGTIRDYVKCACYNRLTLFGILGTSASVGMFAYGIIKKDFSSTALAIDSAVISASALSASLLGFETFHKYKITKKRLDRGKGVPSCLEKDSLMYCDRRGVELALKEYKNKLCE